MSLGDKPVDNAKCRGGARCDAAIILRKTPRERNIADLSICFHGKIRVFEKNAQFPKKRGCGSEPLTVEPTSPERRTTTQRGAKRANAETQQRRSRQRDADYNEDKAGGARQEVVAHLSLFCLHAL